MRTFFGWVAVLTAVGCSSPAQPTEAGADGSTDDGSVGDGGVDAPPVCPCTDGQFCKGTMCFDAVFANICTDPNETVLLDGQMIDDAAGHVFGDALKAACSTTVRYTSGQSIPGVVDPSSSRPITGPGDMAVTAGGPFFQTPAKYMETTLSPAFTRDAQNGSHVQVVERKSQNVALDVAITVLTASHDYFLLQLAFEPQSGTLVFMGYGLYGAGTTAAGWYFQNTLLPNKATYTDRYYLYEWTDTDMDAKPSMGDTFTKIVSGK